MLVLSHDCLVVNDEDDDGDDNDEVDVELETERVVLLANPCCVEVKILLDVETGCCVA